MTELSGVFCVMLTPFRGDGTLDGSALAEMTGRLVDDGVDGLVCLGSNGEAPYLTFDEKVEVVAVVARESAGRAVVVAGAGCFGTRETTLLSQAAEAAGADALMIALPVYYPVGFAEVRNHYAAIANAVGIPILYYDFPTHTHLSVTPDQIADLAEIPGICGSKETILDLEAIGSIVKAANQHKPFAVFTGNGFNLLPALDAGCVGTICPTANLVAPRLRGIIDAHANGDRDRAEHVATSLTPLASIMIRPAPHALLKEAMRRLGHRLTPTVRGPLPQLGPDDDAIITEALARTGLTEEENP